MAMKCAVPGLVVYNPFLLVIVEIATFFIVFVAVSDYKDCGTDYPLQRSLTFNSQNIYIRNNSSFSNFTFNVYCE